MPDEHEKDREFEGRTFLLIRTHPLDDGTEPLAPGLPFWVSPDITVVKPDGTRGDEAAAGEVNQVEVVVTNKGGITAVDAFVDAFVADPSTSFTPATATPVGSDFVTIQGYSKGTLSFPWVPPPGAPSHQCLLARVSLVVPPDTYVNGALFDVVGDRHVAQRNIHVVALSGAKKSLSFAFTIVNPLGRGGDFVVRAREVKLGRAANVVTRALGCGLALPQAAAPLASVRLRLAEAAREDDERAARVPPRGVLRRAEPPGRAASARLSLGEGEERVGVITLTASPRARAGVNVVEVRQTTADGAVVGGLWLVARS